MPLYEFACKDCEEDFEKLVRSAAAASEVTCPKCGGTHVVKKMSAFAAQVKGGSAGSSYSPASSCGPTST